MSSKNSIKNHLPGPMPTVLFERVLHALNAVGDFQIGMVICFSRALNGDLLRQAVQRSIEAIPHLGCRFAPGFKGAVWEKIPIINPGDLFNEKQTQAKEKDLLSFFSNPIDHCKGPQVQALLLKDAGDTLCLKLSHHAADAGGVKEYAYFIAQLYRELLENSHSPPPRPTEFGSRSLKQVLNGFPFRKRMGILSRTLHDLSTNLTFTRPASLPGKQAYPAGRTYSIHHIGEKCIQPLTAWGHLHGFTLNDVLMAASLRAFASPHSNSAPRLIVTADLRRYLQPSSPPVVANLSGWVLPRFDKNPGKTFLDTCRMVNREMTILKADYLGLGLVPVLAAVDFCLPLSWLEKGVAAGAALAAKAAMVAPSFTNMGRIDHHRLDFGGVEVSNAWLLPPIVYPPVFGFGVSGYRNSITLSAGYCSPGFEREDVENFFRNMEKEMQSAL